MNTILLIILIIFLIYIITGKARKRITKIKKCFQKWRVRRYLFSETEYFVDALKDSKNISKIIENSNLLKDIVILLHTVSIFKLEQEYNKAISVLDNFLQKKYPKNLEYDIKLAKNTISKLFRVISERRFYAVSVYNNFVKKVRVFGVELKIDLALLGLNEKEIQEVKERLPKSIKYVK